MAGSFDKAVNAIGDAISSASDAVRSAAGSAAVRDVAKKATGAIDGVYGLIDNVKTLNSLAGHTLRNAKMPGFLKSQAGRWLRNVAPGPRGEGCAEVH